MIKNILKKIIKFYVNKENRSIKKIINENPSPHENELIDGLRKILHKQNVFNSDYNHGKYITRKKSVSFELTTKLDLSYKIFEQIIRDSWENL